MTALFIHFTGFLLIDLLLSMGFGLVLLWATGVSCEMRAIC